MSKLVSIDLPKDYINTYLKPLIDIAMIYAMDVVRQDIENDIKVFSLQAFNDYETDFISSNYAPRHAGDLRNSIRTSIPQRIGEYTYSFNILAGDNEIASYTGIYYAQNMEQNILDLRGPFSADSGFTYKSDHSFIAPVLNENRQKYIDKIITEFSSKLNSLINGG